MSRRAGTTFLLRVLFFFLGVSACLVPVTLFGGTIDPNTPDSQYVAFGKKFPCVVRFVAPTVVTLLENGQPKKITGRMLASAVVIAPHWVLTAAHVLTDASGLPLFIADDQREHPADHVFIHEQFQDDVMGAYDVALCHCAAPFALDFYPALYTQQDEIGKAVTIAGYGTTGTFYSGNTKVDALKRAGHNKIDGVMRGVLLCSPSRHERFPLEFCITPGDSGGGLFIGNELAGINSFLAATDGKPDGTYSDEAAFTRISLYAEWVRAKMVKYEQEHPVSNADVVLP